MIKNQHIVEVTVIFCDDKNCLLSTIILIALWCSIVVTSNQEYGREDSNTSNVK